MFHDQSAAHWIVTFSLKRRKLVIVMSKKEKHNVLETEGSFGVPSKKKKTKSRRDQVSSPESSPNATLVNSSEEFSEGKKHLKKKKEKRNTEEDNEVSGDSTQESERKRKKKKKQDRRNEDKECEALLEKEQVICNDLKEDRKHKLEESEDDDKESERKRKKKKKKDKKDKREDNVDQQSHDAKEISKYHLKESGKKYDDDLSGKMKQKDRNVSAQHRPHKGFGMEEDKQHLVMENKTDDKMKAASAAEKGQWANADVGDSERQEKFFRLLGGYKKKGDSESIFKNKFANRAMNKTQEQGMADKLESQFSQAMEKKRSGRGMGLGYSAVHDPEVKDFHIDKDKVKSIQFMSASEK